ncbi:TetR/AcrR family transcriptional regulator [Isoptericola cucumis]|uniref:HTH tetR-type domain-containing protein n=1 Tax=Isoptericola cucumis TaxID=1776856 RepID=A0ABQ2B419_9MICO|nr:TetR/AcrR family transcriptional regulator [Isoptericola cucumis]GGI05265.1 hypothetical protein GCM10007368_05290 [Isoptericola cucumis]
MVHLSSPRARRTRARILDAALDLFERQGYEPTTVAQVADAAGVTPMTFFRHFPTKDAVLVTDPYDPLIADVVAAQPAVLPPFERVRLGMRAALGEIDPDEDATARRRVALVAANPALRAAVVAATAATEDAIVGRLVHDGVARLDARVAAAACLGACTAALLEPPDDGESLGAVVTRALDLLGQAS